MSEWVSLYLMAQRIINELFSGFYWTLIGGGWIYWRNLEEFHFLNSACVYLLHLLDTGDQANYTTLGTL